MNELPKQKEYCAKCGLPMFAPDDGRCYRCGAPIEDDGEQHITGCRKCCVSFCE